MQLQNCCKQYVINTLIPKFCMGKMDKTENSIQRLLKTLFAEKKKTQVVFEVAIKSQMVPLVIRI